MPIKRLSAFLAALMLGGCQTITALGDHAAATVGLEDSAPKAYTSRSSSEPTRTGVAVSDEPLAARQGAAAMTSGGSAVDAVAAMYFTMTATYPVAAGLGAGGICLVRDTSGRVQEFDFITRAPVRGGVHAVPGAVRGFADMQKQYGALPWQRVVAPGEAYASTGFPVSQMLAQRLADAPAVIMADIVLRHEFTDGTKVLNAGDETRNLILGQALAVIRLQGADGFYKGQLAADIAAASQGSGGAVDQIELAGQKTTIAAPAVRGGTYLPNTRTGAGVFAASLMDTLSRSRGALAQAAQTALAGFGVNALAHDMGSTSFAAVDANGQAAACAVTMNGPFGHSAGNTGVLLASSPAGPAGLASAFLTPVIARNGDGVAAIAGAGGPGGAAAAVSAALEVAGGRQLGHRGDLRSTGNAPFDTVNMASCDAEACAAMSDPGAHGLAAVAEAVNSR